MKKNKIILISSLDNSANEERAKALIFELKQSNYTIAVFDTKKHYSHMIKFDYLVTSPKRFIFYLINLIQYKLRFQKHYPLVNEMKLRNEIINKYIKKNQAKIIICQNPQDMLCILNRTKTHLSIYDSPTIYSEEVKNMNTFPKKELKAIKYIENNVFDKADGVSFHWETFIKLAKELNKPITNPIKANWGCSKRKKLGKFSKKPKIVYIGKLNAPWINPQLLELIQASGGFPLDVFSYEKPEKLFKSLKYSGYLKNLNQISTYQFGLITMSNDFLRNSGFSAKHLLYISYGLPVLCPEWRQDKILRSATISYNKNNFTDIVKYYSKKNNWLRKHQAALKLAKKLRWNKTLKPLIKHIESRINIKKANNQLTKYI